MGDRRLELPIASVQLDDELDYTIDVPHEQVPAWCLELAMLRSGLTNRLAITSPTDELRLSVDPSLPPNSTGSAELAGGRLETRLTTVEISAWESFFLRYYRDGLAQTPLFDVHNLHLEANQAGTAAGVVLNFHLERHVPPLSEVELLKRLGLDRGA